MITTPAWITSIKEQRAAAPECRVADQIVRWSEVREGDLVLWDGVLRLVERINLMDSGNAAVVLDGDQHNGTIPAGTYTAVRRYVTEEG